MRIILFKIQNWFVKNIQIIKIKISVFKIKKKKI